MVVRQHVKRVPINRIKRNPEPPPPPPPPAPVITSIQIVSKDQTSFTVRWDLDQFASGRVEYGTTISYGSLSTLEPCCTYNYHVQTISNLQPDTEYHFRVTSVNLEGLSVTSDDQTVTTDAEETEPGSYPPTINPITYVPMVSASMPSYMGVHNDTTFGTQIRRVSQINDSRHVYSSIPAFNCDGSLLNLGYTPPGRAMIRTSDWTVLTADQGQVSGLAWYHNDPYLAYGFWSTTGIRKLSVNPTTGAVSILKQLTFVTPGVGVYSVVYPGGGANGMQGVQDMNDNYLAFIWKKTNNDWGLGIYSLVTESVAYERTMGNSTTALIGPNSSGLMDNCGMSLTGNWAWFTFAPDGTSTTTGMWIYPTDLSTGTRRQANFEQVHCDWVLNAAGEDMFVFSNVNITRFNPVTGAKNVIGQTGSGGSHISGRAFKKKGWAVISEYMITSPAPGYGTVYAIDIDNPGDVKVYGHNHRTQFTGYQNETHACPNPDMTKIVYAARWEASTLNNAYVMGVTV